MKNVIFLDIDGVLNSGFPEDRDGELREDGLIEREKLRLLAGLVRSMQAELILHSGWRFWFSDGMEPLHEHAALLTRMLKEEGLFLSGKTPDLTTPEIRRTKKFSKVKAQEILAWVKAHEPDSWIVLDDLPLGNTQIEAHQIRTKTENGLTKEDIEEAKKLL